jgi:hypothetical protein
MTFDTARVVEHVHGPLGWVAAAVLAHPAFLLWRGRPRVHLSVTFAVVVPTLAGALGMWVYGPYRDRIKQSIFIDARWIGLLFERKEHLAFGAILLGWAGAAAYALSVSAPEPSRASLRTLALRAFLAASVLALAVAVLGNVVASFRTF